jgi:hypothetical protein
MILRARYTFERVGEIVFIVDLDAGRSVTNDAEAVIRDLVDRGIEVDRMAIIYRDTTGRWDQLRTNGGNFAGFRWLGAYDRTEAARRAGEE